MTTFLASFLVFLATAAALALAGRRGRPPRCGDCPSLNGDHCNTRAPSQVGRG